MLSLITDKKVHCNSPPQVGGLYISPKPNLNNKELKGWGRRDLVKKSASWFCEEIGRSFMIPAASFSLTMWQSISKCLVLSWNTGLADIWRALWLSQYNTGTLVHVICRSFKRYNSHWSSQVAAPRALYSALEEDLETMSYFLVLHEINESPRKKHCLEMDLLMSLQPAQSASGYPWM